MATMGSKLLPFVQAGKLRSSQNVELLLRAEHAVAGHRGVGGASVQLLPGHVVGGAAGLQLPYVGAEDCLALVPQVVE